ncbi:MAG: FMN-binding protein, partial [Tissierellales bacterium]
FSLKHKEGCAKCNKCLEKCPVGLNFSNESNTISPECIRCLECIDSCKVNLDNRVQIGFLNKKVDRQYYIPLMLILFLLIWIGIPQIWSGQASIEDVSLGALKDGSYRGESKGFATKITTEVKITNGKITEIKVINHKESKGWYEEVFMVIPEKIIEKQRLNVDVISGATKSSKGLINSIDNAVRKSLKNN